MSFFIALQHFIDEIIDRGHPRLVMMLLGLIRFLNQAAIGFYRDDGWSMAAALSFSGSLAVIPTSALCFSLFSAFGSLQKSILKVRELILQHMLPESPVKSTIEQWFIDLTANVYGLKFFSIISVLITTVILFITIEYTLNKIFMVKHDPPVLRSMIVFTSLLVWGPLLLGLSGFLFLMAAEVPFVKSMESPYINHAMTMGVSWLLFFLCYYILPYSNPGLFPCLLGGFVSGLLWEIAKFGFSLYVSNLFFYDQIYGQLAFLPMSLVWMYFFWGIFNYGAEVAFCYQAEGNRARMGKESEHDPVLLAQSALASLIIIGRAFKAGESPPRITEIANRLRVPTHIILHGMIALENRKILVAVGHMMNTFIPCRPLDQIRLEDAFWAVIPPSISVDNEAPEMEAIGKIINQVRISIATTFSGENLEQALKRLAVEEAPRLISVTSISSETATRISTDS